MAVITRNIDFNTRGNNDIINVTREVEDEVKKSGIQEGTVTIFVTGSTAGVTTMEYEPGLIDDTKSFFERIIPQEMNYKHNQGSEGNGHAHIRASLLGASLGIPVSGGTLTLGTWQQIVIIDFDNRPRIRRIVIQIMGE